ncbi:M14 family metallopeptidase [Alteromonas profundi]|nr:M14 family metallopeptidase [Alteromonas profundi]
MLATLISAGTQTLFSSYSKCLCVCLFLISSLSASGATVNVDTGGRPVHDYLPKNINYNPDIPTPESVLGMQIGEWHVRHDQLVRYMRVLAEASDRISLEVTGRTHENRELLLLKITASDNQPRLASLQQAHLDRLATGKQPQSTDPLIIYMGYSIHGNEPSGANASLVIAYYLAAAQGEDIAALLNNNVVLLDPSFNPDGLSRFAQWANMHKGKQLVADSHHREHDEGWPSGRTNHYWFDLNRDWLLLTHPESRARIKQFHQWRPHVLTDFHEMSTDSTYFFQPGVRSRKNPMTPDGNVTLTEAMAQYHAKALDSKGELYFTEEGFDDFYVGKGSTYPDVHGSIGILFEQASSRGHLQESINGELAFADTIANQVSTSLSTFEGALANKPAILDYQSRFIKETRKQANDDDQAGYLLAIPKDSGRFSALIDLLNQHQVVFNLVTRDISIDDTKYIANNAIYVPLSQPQYRLVKSLFSTQTSFENNTFYDVSSWNIALAFNVQYTGVSHRQANSIKTAANNQWDAATYHTPLADNAYAYAFDWTDYYAPALLQALLEAGVKARSSESGFTAQTANGSRKAFPPGSIIIPAGPSRMGQAQNLAHLVQENAQHLGIQVHAITSGLTPSGNDLGSRSIAPITPPNVLLVGGKGTSEYEVGEMWHYFDTRVGLPTTIVEQRNLLTALTNKYSHIIFPSGRFILSENTKQQLIAWVEQGGVLIGQKSALRYFAQNEWLNISVVKRGEIDSHFDEEGLTYADRSAHAAQKLVAGSAYIAQIDNSHPLFYGYQSDTLAMFKTSNMVIDNHYSVFSTPARYTNAPLASGFSADAMVDLIAQTPAVVTKKRGKGVVIGFVDNTQFRGYWYATNKMLSNAIYQSHFIRY